MSVQNIETTRKIVVGLIKGTHTLSRGTFLLASTVLGSAPKLVGHFIPTPQLGIGQLLEKGMLKVLDGSFSLVVKGVNAYAAHAIKKELARTRP